MNKTVNTSPLDLIPLRHIYSPKMYSIEMPLQKYISPTVKEIGNIDFSLLYLLKNQKNSQVTKIIYIIYSLLGVDS